MGEEEGTQILDMKYYDTHIHKLANKNYMDYMTQRKKHPSFGDRTPHE